MALVRQLGHLGQRPVFQGSVRSDWNTHQPHLGAGSKPTKGGRVGRLFISHSSVDKPLVASFVRLLETGMAVPGDQILASSVEGRGVPPGVDYRAYLKRELAGSDAVLFLLSPAFYQSPFCMAEYGAAWALESDIFVLVVPPISIATLA
ncbi:MAG TPA: toll/interleukin-1 receptor domain-containing protein, partial [Solirubrobacteraceae bacterium]|nr:toll/interleukin-1 receptor domain-containing protein [Solirubrobacteraceae bacterium]